MCTNNLITNILQWIDFPVLISTILGGVIIWALSESSKRGNLKVFVTENKITGIYSSLSGGQHETSDLQDERITDFHIGITLDVYNSADYVKIARNINFEVIYNNKTKAIVTAYSGISPISSMNFEPKKLELIHFGTILPKKSPGQIDKLFLTFLNESQKIKKIRVHLKAGAIPESL